MAQFTCIYVYAGVWTNMYNTVENG